MSNSGKPLHYLLRGSSGSDAFSRNTSASALRNCIGITEDPFDKNLIASSSKSEMAHEITILKESNNKLLKALVQKERECREFQDHLIVSSKTNADLMDELSELTLENQRLKLKGIAFLEENRALYNQICQLKKMYNKALTHSSRAWEKKIPPGQLSGHKSSSKELKKVEVEPSESWEEISQKLINQMQEEMMELENFNSKYFVDPNKVSSTEYHLQSPLSNTVLEGETSHTSHQNLVPSSIAFSDECELLCAKSLIHHLKSQVEHLRNQTMNQRAVLKSTLEQLHKFSKAFDATRGNTALSTSSKRLSQPSDELFRAYFTKQLHNGSNSPNANGGELLAGAENPFDQPLLKATAKNTPQRKNLAMEPMHDTEYKDATLKATEMTQQEDDKICPICERKFPSKVTQSEFEEHVFDHLDSKNILEH